MTATDSNPETVRPSKPRTMRRELRRYVFTVTVLAAIAFTALLNFYFFAGLSKAIEGVLVLEARQFEQRYVTDPDTPLQGSGTIRLFFDDWRGTPDFYRHAISLEELSAGKMMEVEWELDDTHNPTDGHFLIVYAHPLPDGRLLYVVADYDAELFTEQENEEFDQLARATLYAAPVFILLMVIVVQLFNRRVNRYTSALANWAEQLSLDNLDRQPPDFRYDELNRIGARLQSAFQRIAALLEKEHRFLRNASHELRTPIAVIRANMELLERIGTDSQLQRPLERITRASRGMQQLTETLLWLSRDSGQQPALKRMAPADLIDQCIEDLQYLLTDKPVELLRYYYSEGHNEQSLPATPLRIVLNNLIRNAFQHTQEGDVRILLEGNRLSISNRDNGEPEDNKDDSFGLGITLVQQICDKLGWPLTLVPRDGGITATLELSARPQVPPEIGTNRDTAAGPQTEYNRNRN